MNGTSKVIGSGKSCLGVDSSARQEKVCFVLVFWALVQFKIRNMYKRPKKPRCAICTKEF